MLRNNYPITRLIGASIIALGVVFFAIFYQDVRDALMHNYFRMTNDRLLLLGITVTAFIVGIGLVLRQKWARILLVIFLVMLVLGAIFLTIDEILSFNTFDIVLITGTIFSIIFATSLTALLYNKKLNDEFDEKIVEEFDDTLDSQLFRKSDSIS
jgi:peptidoglycan/LPS O-acetylase OafA/YrhL